jgi:type IX secretion system PorP/SprF family membrane protein
MKNFLTTIVCAIVFVHAQLALAQQQPTYTHYMYNMQSYNPAYVGSRKAISGVGLYRTQWVGYEGAPVTQTICMSAPINKDRLGIGLSFNNDKIGPMKATSAVVDFAYHLPVSETGKLSFGIKAGVNIISSNLSSIKLDDPNDFSFQANVNSKATPNVGFGLYYYAAKFYAGLSAPQLVTKSIKATENGNTVDFYTPKKHFYGTIGFVKALNGSLDLKPTMLLKVVMGAPVQLDLTTTLIYKKIMHAGIMYRSGESVGALIGFTFNNSCMLGYSYDWTILNKTNTYHYGSHELIVRFDLALKKNTKGAFLGYF